MNVILICAICNNFRLRFFPIFLLITLINPCVSSGDSIGYDLSAQSMFQPLIDSEIRDIGMIRYCIFTLDKTVENIDDIKMDMDLNIGKEGVDVSIKFSTKEYSRLPQNGEGETDLIIPATINGAAYYAYVTLSTTETTISAITVFTKGEFEKLKGTDSINHRKRPPNGGEKITHKNDYYNIARNKIDVFLRLLDSHAVIDLKRVIERLKESPIIINEMIRDGLQNHDAAKDLETIKKTELLEKVIASGIRRVEPVSYVNPDKVPAMKDSEDIARYAQSKIGEWPEDTEIEHLVFNLRGAIQAIENNPGLREISINVQAAKAYGETNVGSSDPMGYFREKLVPVISYATEFSNRVGRKIRLRVYISNIWGYKDKEVDIDDVIKMIEEIKSHGVTEIALSDTTGEATPSRIIEVVNKIKAHPGFEDLTFALHLHDRGLGLVNMLAGIQSGITIFDTSMGNLGGSPFAEGAPGNVSTEDFLFLVETLGGSTGIDRSKLNDSVSYLGNILRDDFINTRRVIGLHKLLNWQLYELQNYLNRRLTIMSNALTRDALVAMPEEYNDAGISATLLAQSLVNEGLDPKASKWLDEKLALIFSEKTTFDGGLGILLPKLAKAGIKVAVVTRTDRQKLLIEELNAQELKEEEKKIVFGESVIEVISNLKGIPRFYYFKSKDDPFEQLPDSVKVIDSLSVKQIINAIGNASSLLSNSIIEKLHDAAEKFAMAA